MAAEWADMPRPRVSEHLSKGLDFRSANFQPQFPSHMSDSKLHPQALIIATCLLAVSLGSDLGKWTVGMMGWMGPGSTSKQPVHNFVPLRT